VLRLYKAGLVLSGYTISVTGWFNDYRRKIVSNRKGKYGIDAPMVPLSYGAIGIALLAGGIVCLLTSRTWGVWLLVYAAIMLACAGVYLHSSMRGKFQIWNALLDDLDLAKHARILDLGCGHGTVLIMAAKRLGPNGQAVGIDLWRKVDQSGNDILATKENVKLEGVEDKVILKTGDMMDLPFSESSFDYVFSNLAIHNIKESKGRKKALTEAYRVLKPGGILLILDISKTKEYVGTLKRLSADNIHYRNVGWRCWWTGPWMSTYLVSAVKSKQ
jgi:arsenite methyltransferase